MSMPLLATKLYWSSPDKVDTKIREGQLFALGWDAIVRTWDTILSRWDIKWDTKGHQWTPKWCPMLLWSSIRPVEGSLRGFRRQSG